MGLGARVRKLALAAFAISGFLLTDSSASTQAQVPSVKQPNIGRFVFVQQEVGKLAMTAVDYPPMQKGSSFNLDAVKEKIEEAMKSHQQ